ncbi:hypothetical protein Abr02nite_40800 [Paractinoplanes brasiliensis]|nr:hypothetical protein Abr02nite_40800 [Actinoplanes brasiliensis]
MASRVTKAAGPVAVLRMSAASGAGVRELVRVVGPAERLRTSPCDECPGSDDSGGRALGRSVRLPYRCPRCRESRICVYAGSRTSGGTRHVASWRQLRPLPPKGKRELRTHRRRPHRRRSGGWNR